MRLDNGVSRHTGATHGSATQLIPTAMGQGRWHVDRPFHYSRRTTAVSKTAIGTSGLAEPYRGNITRVPVTLVSPHSGGEGSSAGTVGTEADFGRCAACRTLSIALAVDHGAAADDARSVRETCHPTHRS